MVPGLCPLPRPERPAETETNGLEKTGTFGYFWALRDQGDGAGRLTLARHDLSRQRQRELSWAIELFFASQKYRRYCRWPRLLELPATRYVPAAACTAALHHGCVAPGFGLSTVLNVEEPKRTVTRLFTYMYVDSTCR